MTEERGEAGQRDDHGVCRQRLRHEHGNRSLQDVTCQRQDGCRFAAIAQYVGRTRVFRTGLARILQTHDAGDDHGGRHRAKQVGQQRKNI